MRRPLLALPVAIAAAVALVAMATAAGAGAPFTFSVDPNPATTGETVTLASVQPCPDPGDVLQVEVLIDIPDTGVDQFLYPTWDATTGDWSITFEAGPPADYPISASCVYVQGNEVYDPEVLTVEAAPPTTPTTPTTAEPTTSTTAAPAPAVAATPTFTG